MSIVDLLTFDPAPELTDTQAIDDKVEELAKRVSGSSAPLCIDSLFLFHWLLKHGR